jgi:subtilisin family serine protease
VIYRTFCSFITFSSQKTFKIISMKKVKFLLVVCIVTTVFIGCSEKEQMVGQEESVALKSASIKTKYIIQLKEDASISSAALNDRSFKVKEKAIGLLKKYQIADEIEEVYGVAIQGFTVKMAPGQVKKMEVDPEINHIEADQVIALSPIEVKAKPGGGTTPSAQIIPWGVDRVGGGATYTGSGKVWIIDTGIDYDHTDLNVDVANAANFTSAKSADDDNGHGSHCAGIIAAINNNIGVVGVAAGAKVVPVKVLSRSGSGSTSGVIAGIDYVASKAATNDVANMSLGGGISTALDNAVLNASQKCKFALAAGNESDDANNHSPARVNGSNIYTVSAMAKNDIWASYSNSGNPPVDYCAPGSSIYSCYKGGAYATMSGTSMATPHVAGLLLWGDIATNGYVKGDPDGNADPIAHR